MRYRYVWKLTERGENRFNQLCTAIGNIHSGMLMVQFDDGKKLLVAKRALRIVKETKDGIKAA